MILNFPSLLQGFEVMMDLPKNWTGSCMIVNGQIVVLVAPIALKTGDVIMVVPGTNRVELVKRAGIIVWRAAWAN